MVELSTLKNLPEDSTIFLKDKQSIQGLSVGDAVSGLELIVDEITEYNSEGTQWVLIKTNAVMETGDVHIIVKSFESQSDYYAVWVPSDFQPGTREDVLNNQCHWLFEKPVDEMDFKYSDLEYALTFDLYIDDTFEDCFKFEELGPTNRLTSNPYVEIHEWTCSDEENDNPYAIAIETGGLTVDGISEVGGYVEFYQGAAISPYEIEALPYHKEV